MFALRVEKINDNKNVEAAPVAKQANISKTIFSSFLFSNKFTNSSFGFVGFSIMLSSLPSSLASDLSSDEPKSSGTEFSSVESFSLY